MIFFTFRLFAFLSLLIVNLWITFEIVKPFLDMPEDHPFSAYVWMSAVYLAAYFLQRLMTRRMVTTNESIGILKANVISLLVLVFIITIAKYSTETSRALILGYFLINMSVPLEMYWLKKPFLKMRWMRKDVFAVCDTAGLKNIEQWFASGNPFGYDVRIVLNIETEPHPKIHAEIDRLIKMGYYHAVVIDIEKSDIHEISDMIDHIQKNIRRVILLPKISTTPLINGELISSVHHKGMALYIKNNLLSPVDRLTKRVYDFFAAWMLIVILSPVLILLYGIVFLSSGGRPLFSQERIGEEGKKFRIWKFRTMYKDAEHRFEQLMSECETCREEWEKSFKLKHDPRITRIGHFLRKTSLDELPQLINVVKGEMSLVGPRPIIEVEIEKYGEFFDYFKAVKPGITGLWQVSGRNDIDYDERIQLDVWYVRNWSVELDVEILMKTAAAVLLKQGSY